MPKRKHRRKWYGKNGDFPGFYAISYYVGKYTSRDGITWEVWSPVGNRGSSWNRLEAKGRRTRFMYDAGGHVRRTIQGTCKGHYKAFPLPA